MRTAFWQLLLLVWALPLGAQTKVEVLDNEKKGLPYAHVKYKELNAKKFNTVLTDLNGIAEIPLTFCQNNPDFILSISYVGLISIENDTVKTGKTIRYILKEDQVSLGQLVVTAQYSPNSPDKSVHRISIITSEKIEAMAAVTLTDVLVNELNMSITQDGVLGSQITMQGLGGENVKILIDGVAMIGRSDGNIDLSQINMENIERIEVIEGPMSVIYGTNALAGSINLITKKGGDRQWEGGIHGYTESIGRYNLNGHLNYNKGPHQIGISGGRNYFNGWNPGDEAFKMDDPVADSTRYKQWKPKEQYLLGIQYGYRLKSWNLRYKLDYFDEKITSKGSPRPPYNTSAFDDYLYTNRLDNAFFANGEISDNFRLNFIAAYNIYERRKISYLTDLTTLEQTLLENPGDQDTSRFTTLALRGSITNINASKKINYELGYDINLDEGQGERIEEGKQTQEDYALYASAEYRPWENTVIRPGLRIAYNSNYNSSLNPSLNVKQDINKFALRASIGVGFRAPSLKEQYLDFVDSNHEILGNPNLKAENGKNFSASAKYGNLVMNILYKAELSGFYNNVDNKIDLVPVEGGNIWTYINIDHYQTAGFNANLKMDVHHFKFSLGASYSGQYYYFEGYAEDVYSYWTPQVQFNIAFDFRKIGLTSALFIKYQGIDPYFYPLDDIIVERYTDAYSWADFTLTKKLWKNQISLSSGVKNIFNISSINNSVSVSTSTGTHSVGSAQSIGMGRTFFVSLRYNFKSAL